MKLEPREIPAWPKLAWLARLVEGSDQVTIFHGPMAEVGSDWLAAAVWAGDFSAGDFDQTDLIFGSGVRLRGDKVVFVSSGAGQERLWHASLAGMTHVSNSLPAILATAGLSLRNDYPGYRDDILTVETKGWQSYTPTIPTDSADVHLVYFRNLVFDGRTLREEEKPDGAPGFAGFGDYFAFLTSSARRVGQNLSAAERRHKVVPLATISSGYDSGAAAVIAGYAGCKAAVTIRNSSSLWRGSDSGEQVARHLGHVLHELRSYRSCVPRRGSGLGRGR